MTDTTEAILDNLTSKVTEVSTSMADTTKAILDNLKSKMTEVLTRVQTSPSPITDSPMVLISIKLDGSNYGLWSQVVEMYISRKDKLGYINGYYPQPPKTDPSFHKWCIKNVIVKGWLVDQLHGSFLGREFYSLPNGEAGMGFCCHNIL